MLAAAVCLLALAACGAGSKSTTSTTGASASATSTGASASRPVTTADRAPTKPASRATSGELQRPTPPVSGPIPSLSAAAAPCRQLPQPEAGAAGALRLRDGLQPAIDSLAAFAATRAAGSVAQSERLRAGSVLRAMRAAQSAAAGYVASPTSANRQALATAVLREASTAQAERLSACTIPGA